MHVQVPRVQRALPGTGGHRGAPEAAPPRRASLLLPLLQVQEGAVLHRGAGPHARHRQAPIQLRQERGVAVGESQVIRAGAGASFGPKVERRSDRTGHLHVPKV